MFNDGKVAWGQGKGAAAMVCLQTRLFLTVRIIYWQCKCVKFKKYTKEKNYIHIRIKLHLKSLTLLIKLNIFIYLLAISLYIFRNNWVHILTTLLCFFPLLLTVFQGLPIALSTKPKVLIFPLSGCVSSGPLVRCAPVSLASFCDFCTYSEVLYVLLGACHLLLATDFGELNLLTHQIQS